MVKVTETMSNLIDQIEIGKDRGKGRSTENSMENWQNSVLFPEPILPSVSLNAIRLHICKVLSIYF